MLLGIDPLLGPECLVALRAMGHGDSLVLADANFSRRAYVVIATGERAFYGNLIVRKGVVPPPRET